MLENNENARYIIQKSKDIYENAQNLKILNYQLWQIKASNPYIGGAGNIWLF